MTERNLPTAIQLYLESPVQHVGTRFSELFTDDAVVHDDGNTYVGLESIQRWNNDAASAFTFTREVVEVLIRGAGAVVRVRIEGSFPGSPVELHHHFSLDGNKIALMTICP
jgi:SnoaL-like domain